MFDLKKRNRLFWLLQTSGWLLFFVLSLTAGLMQGKVSWMQIARNAIGIATGFLVTLALRPFYRRLKRRERPVERLAGLILLSSFLAANAIVWLWTLAQAPLQGWKELTGGSVVTLYLMRVIWWGMPLLCWSALYFGFHFWTEWMARRERTERSMALARSARLRMLRYRMNPHFLFNALNSIRALIAEDKPAARRMVTELSEFLRYSLVSEKFDSVPLREEVESIRHYFNIQKARYENKLDVSFSVDPAVEDTPLVSFILHPLAENAVGFGMRTSPLPLRVRISAEPRPGGVLIEVCNSGSWVEPREGERDDGLARGLDYVRRRLAEAYPGGHRFEVAEKDGAVCARLAVGKDA